MKNRPLKDALLSVRLPTLLKERIKKVQSETHVPVSTLTAELMEALCRYVETKGELRIPFDLVPCSENRVHKVSLQAEAGK
ncbi:MAG: hypothetical protein LBH01_07920 [Verrucomicrobiales bacterium]|jgi:hypothetical protein|nr:hypothetical protein [Verrucomicrobiales bacterium]